MGMPITVEIVDTGVTQSAINMVYDYCRYIDETFSTYKDSSEISRINRHELSVEDCSDDMKTVFRLSEQTRLETNGYFNIQKPDGSIDPSGLVKGWAIWKAADLLKEKGYAHFYVEAGGDMQTSGHNAEGETWRVGIRNPFQLEDIVKVVTLNNCGMATSGTYIRGQHIWNPHAPGKNTTDIVSLSVIGPNVYEADRFATAAFAMGKDGIHFLERLDGFEAYMIDTAGIATMTSGFQNFTIPSHVHIR
jgi:thiamine biosynthesis lipoprotein